MTTERPASNGSDERRPTGPNVNRTAPTVSSPRSRFSKTRIARGVAAWLIVQVTLILVAPVVGGEESTLGYGVISTASILASWLCLLWILQLSLSVSTGIGVLVTIRLGWVLGPVDLYGSPVLPSEAYEHYSYLAAWFVVIGVPVLQFALGVARTSGAEATDETLGALALDLRERARRYRRESKGSLFMIITAIGLGATIFVLADWIAALDTHRRLLDVRAALWEVQAEHKDVESEFEEIREQLKSSQASQPEPDVGSSAASQEDLRDSSGQNGERSIVPTEGRSTPQGRPESPSQDVLIEVNANLLRVADRLSGRGRYLASTGEQPDVLLGEGVPLDETLNGIAEREDAEDDLRTILSSLSTRIGAVLLIVFLVQILAGLYRYSARMAAHYDSSADVLSFGDDLEKQDRVRLLSTTHVGFEGATRTPVSQVREIVARTVQALRSSERSGG